MYSTYISSPLSLPLSVEYEHWKCLWQLEQLKLLPTDSCIDLFSLLFRYYWWHHTPARPLNWPIPMVPLRSCNTTAPPWPLLTSARLRTMTSWLHSDLRETSLLNLTSMAPPWRMVSHMIVMWALSGSIMYFKCPYMDISVSFDLYIYHVQLMCTFVWCICLAWVDTQIGYTFI